MLAKEKSYSSVIEYILRRQIRAILKSHCTNDHSPQLFFSYMVVYTIPTWWRWSFISRSLFVVWYLVKFAKKRQMEAAAISLWRFGGQKLWRTHTKVSIQWALACSVFHSVSRYLPGQEWPKPIIKAWLTPHRSSSYTQATTFHRLPHSLVFLASCQHLGICTCSHLST